MTLALRIAVAFLGMFGVRLVYIVVAGRSTYDRLRRIGGELERATDGLTFKWNGCRVGYEPSPEDFITAEPDGVTCCYCGEPWHHSLTRTDSKGRQVPARNPSERCETCARKAAERRGVPWETIR